VIPNAFAGVGNPIRLPGLALAQAMNSGTVPVGTDGFTPTKFRSRLMARTGAMSRMN
jgi:hypothetical protein